MRKNLLPIVIILIVFLTGLTVSSNVSALNLSVETQEWRNETKENTPFEKWQSFLFVFAIAALVIPVIEALKVERPLFQIAQLHESKLLHSHYISMPPPKKLRHS